METLSGMTADRSHNVTRAHQRSFFVTMGGVMSNAGDRPGKGRYTCVMCGHVALLDSDREALPKCPHCGAERYAP